MRYILLLWQHAVAASFPIEWPDAIWSSVGVAILDPIKLVCVGIDNAGKTTVLNLLKGEDPTNVLSTNGFSKVNMIYSKNFDLCVYDLGGGERIRDIWENYYAEVHGVIFVVDTDDVPRKEEAYECIRKMVTNKDVYGKPLLFVLNKVDHGRVDEIEFTNEADLHRLCAQYRQLPYVTHVNKLNKEHLPKKRYDSVRILTEKMKEPVLLAFCSFTDKIIEHWVALQAGVEKAETQLKQRQEEARAARKLRLMQIEHENRLNGNIPMQELTITNQNAVNENNQIEISSPSPPEQDSNIPSEVFEEDQVKSNENILNDKIIPPNSTLWINVRQKRQKTRFQRVTEELERRNNSNKE